MKIEWPTEIAQTPEGQFYQRRLSVLEIILRPIAELVLTTIVTVNDSVIALSTYTIDAFANTFRYLELKYSRGKDKQEQSGGYEYDPYAKDDAEKAAFLARVQALIKENHSLAIQRLHIHPRYQALLRDNHDYRLPGMLFGHSILWLSPDSQTDLALEVLSEFTSERRIIPSMDSDYSSPLLSPVTYRK